ncbi:MAG: hypothetical protein ACE5FI_04585 [Anaerolineales bacterium]
MATTTPLIAAAQPPSSISMPAGSRGRMLRDEAGVDAAMMLYFVA